MIPGASRPLPVGSAVRWASLSQVTRQAVQLVTIVILARSLAPIDFGLVTMALVVIGFVTLFRDLGVGSAVIQSGQADPVWLSTLFWLAVATGIAVTVATVLIAPVIAGIYREPALTDILRVLALSFALTGFGVVQQAILERDLQYGSVARAEMVGAFGGSIVAIGLALGGGGVWSLVALTLVTAALGTLMFWLVSSWRPSAEFHLRHAGAGGSFGAGLTTFNIANFAARNADYFLVGRTLGPRELGFYALAYRIMLVPLQLVTSVVNRVMFPSLARVRDDPERVRRVYLAGVGATAFAAFPVGFGLAATAQVLIPTLLGPQWSDAIPVAIILSVVGVLQAVGGSVGPVFLATGRVRSMATWGIGSSILVVSAFLIGLSWGIMGVAAAYLLASVVLVYPSFRLALGPIGLGAGDVLLVVWRSLANAAVMALVVVLVGFGLLGQLPDMVVLGIQVSMGMAVYALLTMVVNRDQATTVLGQLLRREVAEM